MRITKEVVGALIEQGGKYLIAQRRADDSFGGLWEFPGGTVEQGETKKDALARELKEELGLDTCVGEHVHTWDDEIPTLKITLHLFRCTIEHGEPRPIECQDVRWADVATLKTMRLAPVDVKVARYLEERQKKIK